MKKRLEGRGTESRQVIDERMKRAAEETEGIEKYDFLAINDRLEGCVEEMHALIQAAHNMPVRNSELIAEMRKELASFN